MTFLNSALAFGAMAFLIPLAIHILNRSRFRTVEWGAMHLLESVIKVNHKKFHLEQLILLLVRCAIPVVLALCLARPVLTGSRLLQGDAPVSLVILLDTSYSMDAAGERGSHFDQAIRAATDIVDVATRGSDIAVIQTGGKPTPLFDQPVFDSAAVARRLRQLQGGYGASDMAMAVDEALATLSGMANSRRELIVISDFQPADWDDVGLNAKAIRQQMESMNITPSVTLLPIGQPVEENVAVESLEFPGRALGVGQQLAVRANLRNYGASQQDATRVVLRVDGAEHTVSQVTLPASGTTQVLFPCEFASAGSHVIEVEVVADDRLTTDNRFAAAVTVWDRVDVLLVDGDPSARPLEGETDFLSVALTPFTFGRMRLADLVQTKTIKLSELTEDAVKGQRVVVMANVDRLNDDQLATVTRYVADGGALLVSAGNRIDLNWYREKFFADGSGILPAAYGTPRGKIDDAGESSRIVAQHFEHPALEFFNEAANGDLSRAEIRQWYQLDLATSADIAVGAEADVRITPVVMARLESGDPLLLERTFGEGVVVQLATTVDAEWTDLPLQPAFVPLVQQLVSTMASRISPPRNIQTGEPAVALLPAASPPEDSSDSDGDGAAASSNTESSDKTLTATVVTPNESRRTITVWPQADMLMARYESTQRPGIYVMTMPSGQVIHFVAETSRAESEPLRMSENDIQQLATDMSGNVMTSSAEYLDQDRLRRHGREVWRYVLVGLLTLMFLEVVLQQRFSRVAV